MYQIIDDIVRQNEQSNQVDNMEPDTSIIGTGSFLILIVIE